MKKVLLGLLMFGVVTAPALAVDEQQVKEAIQAAKASFEKAVAAQGGWVSTTKLLKDAELSAAKGDKQKALALAREAKQEAELSYAQMENQKKNWSEPHYLSQ